MYADETCWDEDSFATAGDVGCVTLWTGLRTVGIYFHGGTAFGATLSNRHSITSSQASSCSVVILPLVIFKVASMSARPANSLQKQIQEEIILMIGQISS